jgi:hypothetical protein
VGEEQEPKLAGVAGGGTGRRRTRRWIGIGLAAVIVAIVAFAVAQGGGSDGGPLNAIAKAAEVTQREPGGRAVIASTVASPDTPAGFSETGTMVFDDSGRSRGAITVKGHETGREENFVAIADGTTTYISSEALTSIPEGKKWIEVDYSSAETAMGSSNPAEASPKEGLKILENVQGAEEVGKEDIEGVPTTRYRGTLPESRKIFGVEVHVSASHLDVWIDARDRVRRMHLVVSGSVGQSDVSSTTDMSIDFVDFGRVPKISIPNPDGVFNATGEFEAQIQSAAEGG